MLVQRVNAHRKNYFFGSVHPEGRWQYYTTTLLLKTPIPLLLLAAFGAIAGRMSDERTRRATVLPLALTLIILLALMPTDLNIGVRHVMPLYPLLILAAAGGVTLVLRASSTAAKVAVGALLIWQLSTVPRTHPDYLAYFNELGGSTPGRFLIDGDLDLGQDLKRMERELRQRNVDSIWIAYAGSRNLGAADLPAYRLLPTDMLVKGWIVMSCYKLHVGAIGDSSSEGYAWLRHHKPVARVGKSMLLYHVE